jgi:hypothetical protein
MQIKDSEEANSKIRQAEEVERELEERPLAKAQESLDSKTEAPKDPSVAGSGDKQNTPPIPDALEHRIKKAILNNDDKELVRVEDILCEVHRKFYEMNDARSQERNRSIPDVAVCIIIDPPLLKADPNVAEVNNAKESQNTFRSGPGIFRSISHTTTSGEVSWLFTPTL